MAAQRPSNSAIVAFASLIGTSIEWYFFIYGLAAALVFPVFSAFELATKAFLWTTAWGQTFRARMPHPGHSTRGREVSDRLEQLGGSENRTKPSIVRAK